MATISQGEISMIGRAYMGEVLTLVLVKILSELFDKEVLFV